MEKDILALSNYVTITQNNSKYFSPDDIVHICKRKNNAKRDFLFVNAFQGKHLSVSPTTAFTLYDELVNEIRSSISQEEKLVVIGFAETATAIGQYIACSLENCIYYMQTTRESISGVAPLLEFREEHSHATEQLLYGKVSEFLSCDRILFVDDEISTGNTILNFISALENIGIHKKYSVASFLNWQNEKWTQKFKQLDISTHYIVRGILKDLAAKVPVTVSDEHYPVPTFTTDLALFTVKCDIANFYADRLGKVPVRLKEFADILYSNVDKVISTTLLNRDKEVLVLGTEEFMFAPLVFGKMLSKKRNVFVQFHATTRSPIETSNLGTYAISKCFPIASCYDSSRHTFVYNLKKYDKVYIVTDVVPNDQFLGDIVTALTAVGTQAENIIVIVLK